MKKNISDLAGTAGKVISNHAAELKSISSMTDIRSFLNKISPEMSESAQKYVRNTIQLDSPRTSFISAYRCLYNIVLAGYSDCKVN